MRQNIIEKFPLRKAKIFKIIIITTCLIIGGMQLIINNKNNNNELNKNYFQTNAEIIFIGKTGKGINTKAYLGVNYYYENEKYTGYITRTYKKEGYYNKGDEIIIYINKNNVDEIK